MMICTFCPIQVKALNINETSTIEYYEDGSYDVISIESPEVQVASTTTVTKSKTFKHYDSGDNLRYYIKVTGTFTYNGSTSKCTTASISTKTYTSTYTITLKSSSKSGNKAIAKATIKKYYDGTCIQTLNKTVTLTCDKNGNFS